MLEICSNTVLAKRVDPPAETLEAWSNLLTGRPGKITTSLLDFLLNPKLPPLLACGLCVSLYGVGPPTGLVFVWVGICLKILDMTKKLPAESGATSQEAHTQTAEKTSCTAQGPEHPTQPGKVNAQDPVPVHPIDNPSSPDSKASVEPLSQDLENGITSIEADKGASQAANGATYPSPGPSPGPSALLLALRAASWPIFISDENPCLLQLDPQRFSAPDKDQEIDPQQLISVNALLQRIPAVPLEEQGAALVGILTSFLETPASSSALQTLEGAGKDPKAAWILCELETAGTELPPSPPGRVRFPLEALADPEPEPEQGAQSLVYRLAELSAPLLPRASLTHLLVIRALLCLTRAVLPIHDQFLGGRHPFEVFAAGLATALLSFRQATSCSMTTAADLILQVSDGPALVEGLTLQLATRWSAQIPPPKPPPVVPPKADPSAAADTSAAAKPGTIPPPPAPTAVAAGAATAPAAPTPTAAAPGPPPVAAAPAEPEPGPVAADGGEPPAAKGSAGWASSKPLLPNPDCVMQCSRC